MSERFENIESIIAPEDLVWATEFTKRSEKLDGNLNDKNTSIAEQRELESLINSYKKADDKLKEAIIESIRSALMQGENHMLLKDQPPSKEKAYRKFIKLYEEGEI